MRRIPILALCAASLSNAAHGAFEEVRELSLAADGINTLEIDAGAGSLDVIGDPGLSEIMVTATIYVPGSNDDKARSKIERKMVLALTGDDGSARLEAHFGNRIWGFGKRSAIQLEVRIPEGMNLAIDDGIGSIDVENVHGDLSVVDGTGHLTMKDVGGNVTVKDGTGSITVSGVGGDISVRDGTGGIKIKDVAGSVTVKDGTGGINVTDVEKNLIIVSSGAGGLRYSNIGGSVDK